MGKKEEKTNVMRLLDQAKIEYKHYCYAGTDAVGGMEVVEVLHQIRIRHLRHWSQSAIRRTLCVCDSGQSGA